MTLGVELDKMRKTEFSNEEYYHLVNRGVGKKNIFTNQSDYTRFLFLILNYQSPITINNPSRIIKNFNPSSGFKVSNKTEDEVVNSRYIELVAFCLMPNHFHILVKQTEDKGVSRYMQRIQNAYTKYFNTKYQTNGHLFQGPFRANRVEDNDQLLYLSAYIHKNSTELPGWRKREVDYQWSSLGDYVKENRWPKLLKPEIILEQFNNKQEYQEWIKDNSAKETPTKLD